MTDASTPIPPVAPCPHALADAEATLLRNILASVAPPWAPPLIHLTARLMLAGDRRAFTGLGCRETHAHSHQGFTAPIWAEMEKLVS